MARRNIRVVGAMLEREPGRYLITQRRPTGSLPLLWEFPGGRVEEGESEEQALARELKEEMGIDVVVRERVAHTRHEYTHYDIDFSIFRCKLEDPNLQIQHRRVHDHRWVSLEEMPNYKFPDADTKTLSQLLNLDDD
jgi:8-oxo-dGTP diphosphatase